MKKRLLSVLLASTILIILFSSQVGIVASAVRPRGTSLLIGSTPNPSKANQAITISGRLVSGSQGLAYRNVRVDSSVDGRIWGVVAWTKTKMDGRFALSWAPPRSTPIYVRAYFPGDNRYSSSFSSTIHQEIVSRNSSEFSFGFCIHWPDVEQYTNPTYQEKFANSGAKWTRSDVQRISTTEKFKDMYRTYHSLGIKNLGIIDMWTVPLTIRGNFTLDDWRNVVRTVMSNYEGLLDAVEVWNEPDLPAFECGYMDGSIEHYYDMLVVAYKEIKAIAPNVLVIAGAVGDIREGGSGPGPRWGGELLKGIFKLGASNYCDIVSFHYYPWYTEETPAQVLARVYKITGKPVWITEFGSKDRENNNTEQTQRDWLSSFLASINKSMPGPQVVMWYMFHAPSPGTEEQPYCILNYDYREKPGYRIFKTFAKTT